MKITTNQNGIKGFMFQETFIINPYVTECMRLTVNPKKYYGLSDDQLIHFEHLKQTTKGKQND